MNKVGVHYTILTLNNRVMDFPTAICKLLNEHPELWTINPDGEYFNLTCGKLGISIRLWQVNINAGPTGLFAEKKPYEPPEYVKNMCVFLFQPESSQRDPWGNHMTCPLLLEVEEQDMILEHVELWIEEHGVITWFRQDSFGKETLESWEQKYSNAISNLFRK